MTRPRAADDFAVIRARLEELRRSRVPASEEPRIPVTYGMIIVFPGPGRASVAALSSTSVFPRSKKSQQI